MKLSTERYRDKNEFLNIFQNKKHILPSEFCEFKKYQETDRVKSMHTHWPTDPEYIFRQNFPLLLLFLLSLILFTVLSDRVSDCCPSWSGTHYGSHSSLEFKAIFMYQFTKVWVIMPSMVSFVTKRKKKIKTHKSWGISSSSELLL